MRRSEARAAAAGTAGAGGHVGSSRFGGRALATTADRKGRRDAVAPAERGPGSDDDDESDGNSKDKTRAQGEEAMTTGASRAESDKVECNSAMSDESVGLDAGSPGTEVVRQGRAAGPRRVGLGAKRPAPGGARRSQRGPPALTVIPRTRSTGSGEVIGGGAPLGAPAAAVWLGGVPAALMRSRMSRPKQTPSGIRLWPPQVTRDSSAFSRTQAPLIDNSY